MTAPGHDTDIGRISDADWIAAGFRWSTTALLKEGQSGLWQKRIRNEKGTAYFVTVFVWDWREFRVRGCPRDWSYAQEDQFHRGDDYFNVSRQVRSPADALDFAAEVWGKLGCDHYELNEPLSPAPSAADESPTTPATGQEARP